MADSNPLFYSGCPMWANRDWVGRFFRSDCKPRDYLRQYASVFNSVEGNTTFYALPKADTVLQWRDAVPAHFRFCFKFPRIVSHDLQLLETDAECDAFFTRLLPLGRKLGPFFLQLPPSFCDGERLFTFLSRLPRDFEYAVEVRHPQWFQPDWERALDQMLIGQGVSRVFFDTHRLMALRDVDAAIATAQRKKPTVPRRTHPVGSTPILRFVGDPHIENDDAVVADWAAHVAAWIRQGRRPFVFLHQAPDDERAPELGRRFHQILRKQLAAVAPEPEWPVESEPPQEEQLSLF
ncbi:DUF72 domain-containing protein [Acanthopleuribacter pedis]|uniref:DUF72 domain-containing protein n=1 Tax=Acanthopleuribacter pedis TaxID=442870 RepID=A0A8J7QMA4_9BACT|nr:DUF72 domain-containing protein [Acanthopleuribacter pedis]MBO1320978.1 DUF72 domain-containing protein [Acanthopleuribacter pedis]